MSWSHLHTQAQEFAAQAAVSRRRGDHAAALNLYRQAASLEAQAVAELDFSKARTVAITAVSAASLYYKANAHTEAEQLAHKYLAEQELPEFGRQQLQEILQNIWAERVRAQANIQFAPGQVLVSVKGGSVVVGGAPLDLIVQKVEGIQNLFFRTAELLKNRPHRRRGGPPKDIQELCRPWLFQAAPGSYQFAVAVEEPKQTELFPEQELSGEKISDMFLTVLKATISDPDHGLDELVPDPEYRATFVKLTRNLAPTGKTFSEMSIRRAGEDVDAITLSTDIRKALQEASRPKEPNNAAPEERETVRGVLRGVHLDKDWLELMGEDQNPIRVVGVGDTVDDLIGPMVNHPVVVEVTINSRGQRVLRDIQSDE